VTDTTQRGDAALGVDAAMVRPVTVRRSRDRLVGGNVRRRAGSRKRTWWAFVFLLPTLIAFGVFSWLPIAEAVRLAFQRTNLVTAAEWVGLDNFQAVLADPVFLGAARNTLLFAVLHIGIAYPLAIGLAVVISTVRRGGGWYRTLVYLPVVIPPVVGVLMWKFFYNTDNGLFNAVLESVGLPGLSWVQAAATALPSLALQHIWASVGGTVLIYIAALSQVERELYEAAEVDGASILRRLWHVALPRLRGLLLVMLLLSFIGILQIFTEPYVMTGGGPANSTNTILLIIYRYAFAFGDWGKASAASVLLAIVLCALSAVYLRATRKWSTS
jgi:multiple sugar transport system permease protein